jgi:hypothetical protein
MTKQEGIAGIGLARQVAASETLVMGIRHDMIERSGVIALYAESRSTGTSAGVLDPGIVQMRGDSDPDLKTTETRHIAGAMNRV